MKIQILHLLSLIYNIYFRLESVLLVHCFEMNKIGLVRFESVWLANVLDLRFLIYPHLVISLNKKIQLILKIKFRFLHFSHIKNKN